MACECDLEFDSRLKEYDPEVTSYNLRGNLTKDFKILNDEWQLCIKGNI